MFTLATAAGARDAATTSASTSGEDVLYSKERLDAEIASGKLLIVYGTSVYDVTKFIKHHPGGLLPIQHMVGKEATDQINAFHPKFVITNKIPRYRVGTFVGSFAEVAKEEVTSEEDEGIAEGDFPPSNVPVDDCDGARSGVQTPLTRAAVSNEGIYGEASAKAFQSSPISVAYRELEKKIRDLGYFEVDYAFYVRRLVYYGCLWLASIGLVLFGPQHILNYSLSATLLAAFWWQVAFVAHDAGHNSVAKTLHHNSLIGILLGDAFGGLSIGWWKKSHDVHHIVTNSVEHDPDIQQKTILVDPRYFDNIFSTYHERVLVFDKISELLVPLQHYIFLPTLCLGRFNLYAQSYLYLLFDRATLTTPASRMYRKLEVGGIIFFWTWYALLLNQLPSWGMVALYVFVSHALTVILHLQITVSHFGMSTEDEGEHEDFVVKMLRTTMDVECPAWLDWFYGGLHFQVEHHLFPRVPRVNLRKIRPLVAEFCKEHGLTLHTYGFVEGNEIVIGRLKEVAHQIKLLMATANPDKRHTAKGH